MFPYVSVVILTRDREVHQNKEIRFNIIWLADYNIKEKKKIIKVITWDSLQEKQFHIFYFMKRISRIFLIQIFFHSSRFTPCKRVLRGGGGGEGGEGGGEA